MLKLGDVDDFAIGVEVDGVGLEKASALFEEVAVGVEELDAVVGAVADPDAVVLVQADAVGECELAGAFSPVAPGEDVLAGGGVFVDAGVVVAVGDEEVAVGGDGEIGGQAEGFAGCALLTGRRRWS